ncbi:Clavaminate synthase-like protein [Microthyrium microscopicum]|uniref:Clavaminate synthase-like protein n=1 Tax=Microthyrium microscopicum TaxID=703497 RepID=A0A6A6UD78_9PEZI|nr:Clavaminate synthase-like protein [Microthyrium microscopicum]
MSTLPVISLAPLLTTLPSPSDLQNTLNALSSACTTHGFFYLTDHGIPPERLKQVLTLTRNFFKTASPADKERLARQDPDGARGFQRLGENVTLGKRDAHEAVDFYREWDESNSSLRPKDGTLGGKNLWPEQPADLKAEMNKYVEEVLKVGSVLVEAMGRALGLDGDEANELVRCTDKSFWVMRMIGYPPLEDCAEGVSCGEHTDYGCVTLLLADETPNALQVLTRSGEWIYANPIPGAYVVNIGDMIERWTNGLWKSTLHRVIHTGSNYRVSVPFFFEPNFNARIRPLKKCIEKTGGKEIGDEVVYGDHLIGKIKGNFY